MVRYYTHRQKESPTQPPATQPPVQETSALQPQAAGQAPALSEIEAFGRLLTDEIGKVIIGKANVVELLGVALLCEGHVLIEDVPGIGKTTLARTLAACLNAEFRRIQFTPDLLPSDVTGIFYFNQRSGDFEFRAGPIHANVILADEINRATPRTQSSLLEAMEERQVTVEGHTSALPR